MARGSDSETTSEGPIPVAGSGSTSASRPVVAPPVFPPVAQPPVQQAHGTTPPPLAPPPPPAPPAPAPPPLLKSAPTRSPARPQATPTDPTQPTGLPPAPPPTPRSTPLSSAPRSATLPPAPTPLSARASIFRQRSRWNWFGGGSRLARLADAEHLAQLNLAEKEEQHRRTPSWLVSFVVHLLLLLILAIIPIADLASGPITFFLGSASGDLISDFELTAADSSQSDLEVTEPVTETAASAMAMLKQVELPELVASDSIDALATAAVLQSLPFGIAQGLDGRTGAMKQSLLSRFGGTAATEEAVELGLQWLAKQQSSNGSWSLRGPYSGGGASENTTAATALAVNAFLGAGYTHQEGKYRHNMKLAIAYLVRRQDSDGFFAGREPSRQQMYAQAIASISIIEAYGMTEDSKLRIPAQKAIKFAEWSQSDLRGWRYDPRDDADLSVTGWFVMAMETGKMSGLKVDDEKLERVADFLDSVAHEEGSRYGYTSFEPPSLSMTAEGLLCRIYLGWPRTHPSLLAAIRDDLLPNVPRLDDREFSVYYWYYATQVLHHVGGEAWREWNDAMRSVLPALQERDGKEMGSWDASRDVFGAAGGRLYTTCLNLYCLEVYYRHLAIYDLDAADR